MAAQDHLEVRIRTLEKIQEQVREEDLPNRVTKLEAQMSEVREDVLEARRDIAEIKNKFEGVATKEDLLQLKEDITEAILERDKVIQNERNNYISILRMVIYSLLGIVGTIALGVAGAGAGAKVWNTLFGG